MEDNCIVVVGNLEVGYMFYGPFDEPSEAEAWIKENVHEELKADWHYLNSPDLDDQEFTAILPYGPRVTVGGKQVKIKQLEDKVVLEPASNALFNESGQYIGEQMVVPGA